MGRTKKENSEETPPVKLDSVKWINTPFALVKSGVEQGMVSLPEQKVLLKVSEILQSFISEFYEKGRDKSGEEPLSLFTQKVISEGGLPTIHMNAADLGETSSRYADVFQAFIKLSNLKVKGPKFDETGKYLGDDWFNVFSHFYMPKRENGYRYIDKDGQEQTSDRYDGYADFTINPDVALYAFRMEGGYVNHPKEIAFKAQQYYAPLVYFLLKHHSSGKSKVTVPYSAVQDITGVVKREPKDRHIISNQFPLFSKFKQRVLEPAKAELERMGEKNLIDITFTYEPIYKGRVKRGDPDAISFTVIQTDLGVYHTATKKKKAEMLAEQAAQAANTAKKTRGRKSDTVNQTLMQFEANFAQDILDSLRLEFGSGAMGYDYYFGKNASCEVGEESVSLKVPASMRETILRSGNIMDKITKCVTDVLGKTVSININ